MGVPLSRPVEESKLMPLGSKPEIDHAYGGVPFIAESVNEYGTPTCPLGSEAVVSCSESSVMLISSDFVAVRLRESVTWNVIPKLQTHPAPISLLITPVEELRT